MKYFYDTEFIEDGKTIDLISIGVVAEDGREFYAQNFDCDFSLCSGWVEDNVYPHLLRFDMETYKPNDRLSSTQPVPIPPWYLHGTIGRRLIGWIGSDQLLGDDKPEFWGYYADYDHVALCQLFGTMMDLPKGFPMYTRDLKQWCDQLGNPKLPEQGKGEHHALADAKWNKLVYDFLESKEFLSAKA